MKAILEFNLPEERGEFELAQKGDVYKYALDEVWDRVFRPFYKHGYPEARINELIEKLGENDNGELVCELIDRLSDIYRNILDNGGIND